MNDLKLRAFDGKSIRKVWKCIWNDANVLNVFFHHTNHNEPGHLSNQDERLVLMRYTGITDRNEVEICEGDILQVVCWTPYEAVVEWRGGKFITRNISVSSEEVEHYGEHIDDLIRVVSMLHCTIIGNIYENRQRLQYINDHTNACGVEKQSQKNIL
jgi:uncharacterized phage protein (TIGR01671 family)